MPASYAPARSTARSPITRCLASHARAVPANDNSDGGSSNGILEAALRHFARHGLGAARAAHAKAESALRYNDLRGADTWLEICRTLDKRLAADLERQMRLQGLPSR